MERFQGDHIRSFLVGVAVAVTAPGVISCEGAILTEDHHLQIEVGFGSSADPHSGESLIEFEVLAAATTPISGLVEGRRDVIRDRSAWEAHWALFSANVHPPTSAPAVNFDQRMVIVAAMGQKPTGGYRIEISKISRVESTIYVTVTELSPGPTCNTIQALTRPTVTVLAPRMDGRVEFIEKTLTLPCG